MKTMRCRNFFRLVTIFNLCQVGRNMYTLKFGRGVLEIQCTNFRQFQSASITRQKQQKLIDQSYLILTTAFCLLMYTEFQIGILLHWPFTLAYCYIGLKFFFLIQLLPYTQFDEVIMMRYNDALYIMMRFFSLYL